MHIVWQILNIALLGAALVFFLRKPLAKLLARRSQRIRDSLREVYSAREETLARLALVDAQIKALAREVEEIKNKARKEVDEQRERLLKEAEQECQSLNRSSQQYIERKIDESQKRLKAYAIEKAISCAEEKIALELSEDFHNKLIDAYIKQLSKRT
jgi:F-type H+-transporting ATPase subunit b